MRTNGTMTPIPMPGFHHHPAGGAMAGPPHHQMYRGQNGQGLMPSQPMGYGYQLQFMPRPRSGPANFVMPYPLHRQNQHGPRVGFRRGTTNMQQQQHFQQQQVCNVKPDHLYGCLKVCHLKIGCYFELSYYAAKHKLGNEILGRCRQHERYGSSCSTRHDLFAFRCICNLPKCFSSPTGAITTSHF